MNDVRANTDVHARGHSQTNGLGAHRVFAVRRFLLDEQPTDAAGTGVGSEPECREANNGTSATIALDCTPNSPPELPTMTRFFTISGATVALSPARTSP